MLLFIFYKKFSLYFMSFFCTRCQPTIQTVLTYIGRLSTAGGGRVRFNHSLGISTKFKGGDENNYIFSTISIIYHCYTSVSPVTTIAFFFSSSSRLRYMKINLDLCIHLKKTKRSIANPFVSI